MVWFYSFIDSQHSEGGYLDYGGGGDSCFQTQNLLFNLIWMVISLALV